MNEERMKIIEEGLKVTSERIDGRAAVKQQHREDLAAYDKVTRALEASTKLALRKHSARKIEEKQ